MPIGEIIADIVVRPIFEVIILGFLYFFGWLTLSVISFGRLNLAPLSNYGEKSKNEAEWYTLDYNLWTTDNPKTRELRVEFTCFVGFLLLVSTGALVYWFMK